MIRFWVGGSVGLSGATPTLLLLCGTTRLLLIGTTVCSTGTHRMKTSSISTWRVVSKSTVLLLSGCGVATRPLPRNLEHAHLYRVRSRDHLMVCGQ